MVCVSDGHRCHCDDEQPMLLLRKLDRDPGPESGCPNTMELLRDGRNSQRFPEKFRIIGSSDENTLRGSESVPLSADRSQSTCGRLTICLYYK